MNNAERKYLHPHQRFRLVTATCIAVLISGCLPERDNPDDPLGINPNQRDGGSDVAVDVSGAKVDAAVDQSIRDVAIDQTMPDAGIDMPIPDLVIDMALADAMPDAGMDSAIDSNQTVVPDITPDLPSIDGPKILRLVKGGITSAGITTTGASKYRLIENGFELKDTVCGVLYCVTGGITP